MTGERAPARHVALDGAVNVRDIGGYRSVGGPEVVRGRLFRGDSLSQLTSSDTERLDQLGLRTVIDFRTPGEVLLGGDDHLPFAVEYAHCRSAAATSVPSTSSSRAATTSARGASSAAGGPPRSWSR